MIIRKAEYKISAVNDQQILTDLPNVVLFGRSNVGKSTFINVVTNRKKLSYTSKKPGKTKCLNFFNINDYIYLVDVPGYGYAKVSKEQKKKFEDIITNYIKKNARNIIPFLFLDIRHLPTNEDILMIDFLKYYNLKFNIIFTKIDKLSNNKIKKNLNEIKKIINIYDNYILCSSIKRVGIEEFWNKISNNIDNIKKI